MLYKENWWKSVKLRRKDNQKCLLSLVSIHLLIFYLYLIKITSLKYLADSNTIFFNKFRLEIKELWIKALNIHIHVTPVWWMLWLVPLWLFHVCLLPSLSHWLWLTSLALETDQWPSALTCMDVIHHYCFRGVCDGLVSAVCPYSGTASQVPRIPFIWMETVRIIMINIANPPVCFVPGIRFAKLIHWSFLRGFGERMLQNVKFILGSTWHCI